MLKKKGLSTAVGDEGGFAPKLDSAEAAIEVILQATKDAGYKAGKQIFLALDVASSEFYDAKRQLRFQEEHRPQTQRRRVGRLLRRTLREYPIISIEDGCAENDWKTWKALTDKLGDKVQLVGDDLFVTNVKFLRKGIDEASAIRSW